MTTLGLRDLGFVGGASLGASHPETINWIGRVVANGGTVSASTISAVDNFCKAIDAQSGLRAAITRLNLFCGDQLAAALVPLYLAESAGAAAKGNATDVNSGSTLFASSNYSASGSTGGITGNGTSYLNTGLFNSQCATATSGHLSFSGAGSDSTKAIMGTTKDSAEATIDDIVVSVNIGGLFGIVDVHRRGSFSFYTVNTSPKSSYSHWINTQTSSSSRVLYSAGVAIMTSTNGASSLALNSTHPYYVFATNVDNTSGASPTNWRLRQYSIGSGLTAAQAAAFSSAVAAFNTALGR